MEAIWNRARSEAERVMGRVAQPRMAVVSSYDPDTYAVKVKLQPEGTETGWAPLAVPQVGNGWGILSPPSIGDQVAVVFQEGATGSPIVVGSVYSNEDRPVVTGLGGCPAGEFWIVHQSGARIRFLKDGTLEIQQQAGSAIKMNPDGSVEVNAPVLRVGALAATFRRLLDERFHAWAVQHTHPNTGPPVSPPPLAASATTNLTGA